LSTSACIIVPAFSANLGKNVTAGVHETSGKFVAGVNDTYSEFAARVVDTSGTT